MMGVTSVDVALRYFLNAPLKGAFEMTEISMAMVIFAGISLAAVRREHITVDLLESRTPPWLRRWQRVFADLVCAVALGVLAWRIAVRAESLLASRETTLVLGVLRGHVAWAMAVLCVIAAGVFLWWVWRGITSPAALREQGENASAQGSAL